MQSRHGKAWFCLAWRERGNAKQAKRGGTEAWRNCAEPSKAGQAKQGLARYDAVRPGKTKQSKAGEA